MKRETFFTLTFLIVTLFVAAQKNPASKNGNGTVSKGVVTGIVHDKNTGAPVEFANVIVCKNSDSSMVNGALTTAKGRFTIDNVPYGNYFIKINFIGYGVKTISNVNINDNNTYMNIHTVFLETAATNLDAVTITGQKDQVEYNLDKKVINVDKNLLTSGGTALDIMQTIPSVDVDIEGNVSLRGSQNVTIFIDGRPSGLTSLDQMPASMIDRVEIVTNPSARYDPDGMSGIINIVTKRKKEAGYYGMISANVGTGGKYTGSLNFGYNVKKFNIYTNLDGRIFGMKSYTDSYREVYQNDSTYYYKQLSESKRQGKFGNIKLGADYFINTKNTLSVYGEYNIRRFNPDNFTDYYNFDYDSLLTSYYTRQNNMAGSHGGYELGLDYKLTFNKKGRELTASVFYSNTPSDDQTNITTTYYNTDMTPGTDPAWVQRNISDEKNLRFYGQVDYIHQMDKWGRIEGGYKYQYRSDYEDYQSFYQDSAGILQYDSMPSNIFKNMQQLHSAYLIYANNIKKFNNSTVLLPLILSLSFFTFLTLASTKNTSVNAQKQTVSYSSSQYYKLLPYYEWQVLGKWYLKGYTNASIIFEIDKDRLGRDILEINSENIDLFTLNIFPQESYVTKVEYDDFNDVTDYYNLQLINGKIGTLYLTRDNQTLQFLRYKTKNAKEGLFKTNCGCAASLSRGN